MKRFFLVLSSVACPFLSTAQSKPAPDNAITRGLKNQAADIVDHFERAVQDAGHCILDADDILDRFDPKANIEVSNVKTGVKKPRKPKEYLDRLNAQSCGSNKIYHPAKIDYQPVNAYADAIVYEGEGKYRVVIEIDQTFKGIGANGTVLYCDVTLKSVIIEFSANGDKISAGKIIDIKVTNTSRCRGI